MKVITLRHDIRINLDNIAFTEDFDECPPGMTIEEACSEGQVWPVTRIVFCAPEGEYGPLKLDLAHGERNEFLKLFTNGHTS